MVPSFFASGFPWAGINPGVLSAKQLGGLARDTKLRILAAKAADPALARRIEQSRRLAAVEAKMRSR